MTSFFAAEVTIARPGGGRCSACGFEAPGRIGPRQKWDQVRRRPISFQGVIMVGSLCLMGWTKLAGGPTALSARQLDRGERRRPCRHRGRGGQPRIPNAVITGIFICGRRHASIMAALAGCFSGVRSGRSEARLRGVHRPSGVRRGASWVCAGASFATRFGASQVPESGWFKLEVIAEENRIDYKGWRRSHVRVLRRESGIHRRTYCIGALGWLTPSSSFAKSRSGNSIREHSPRLVPQRRPTNRSIS